jgi:ribosome-associated heat shock protein Hsp15
MKVGDTLTLRQGPVQRELRVLGLSAMRGPAPVAQALYAETAESMAAREAAAARRRMGVEPADTLAHGRPTKRDRRQLADWQRWSASTDELG